jgi:hypothetical protein
MFDVCKNSLHHLTSQAKAKFSFSEVGITTINDLEICVHSQITICPHQQAKHKHGHCERNHYPLKAEKMFAVISFLALRLFRFLAFV